MNAEDYINKPYHRVFLPCEEGGYFVCILELAGCMSQGDTFEEAWAMIADAMAGWIEAGMDNDMPIPPPLSDREFLEFQRKIAWDARG